MSVKPENQPSTHRSTDLDGMRGLAILGVICLHAVYVLPEGIGLTAVPYFVIMAIVMTARSLHKRPDQSTASYISKRIFRLYPAFLFWCVIYEAIRQLKSFKDGGLSNIKIDFRGLIGGTYEHLWFVPFLLLSTIIIVPIVKSTYQSSMLRKFVALLSLFLAITIAVLPVPVHIQELQAPWLFIRASYWAIPSLLIGISMAMAQIDSNRDLHVPKSLGLIGFIVLATSTALEWDSNIPWLPAATYGGLGAAWLAMSGIASPVLSRFAKLGELSLGIYLSHVLFLRILAIVVEKKGWGHSPILDIAGFAFALLGGIATTWFLNRSKFTRWTIGS